MQQSFSDPSRPNSPGRIEARTEVPRPRIRSIAIAAVCVFIPVEATSTAQTFISEIARENGPAAIGYKPASLMKQAGSDAAVSPDLALAIIGADVSAGEAISALCGICHTFGEGDGHGIGPNLFDVVGRSIGGQAGYVYSAAMGALNLDGAIWTLGRLSSFLTDPATDIVGTRMGFVGLSDEIDRINLLAYLRSLSGSPIPLSPVTADVAAIELAPLTIGADQAIAGRTRFRRDGCADCHAPNLVGIVDTRENGDGDGPPLIGPRFVERWFGGPVSALFEYMVEMMPPDRPGTLETVVYANILAFILAENGFVAGQIDLPAEVDRLAEMGFRQ